MLNQIQGLHHVTSMASDARANNAFFTDTLGLRRVKKTVNFDAPERLPPLLRRRARHAGLGDDLFSLPQHRRARHRAPARSARPSSRCRRARSPSGASGWRRRGVGGLAEDSRFGEKRLSFAGPDGDELRAGRGRGRARALDRRRRARRRGDPRLPFGARSGCAMPARPTSCCASWATRPAEQAGERHPLPAPGRQRRRRRSTSRRCPARRRADLGAGSVHHIAFAVPDRAAQLEVRKALVDTGYQVTPVIDRDYFWSIYFRTPGGVLFEVATNEPGFDRDEDTAHLGEALKLPQQHAHLRDWLEKHLEPIGMSEMPARPTSTTPRGPAAGQPAGLRLPRHRRRREPVRRRWCAS